MLRNPFFHPWVYVQYVVRYFREGLTILPDVLRKRQAVLVTRTSTVNCPTRPILNKFCMLVVSQVSVEFVQRFPICLAPRTTARAVPETSRVTSHLDASQPPARISRNTALVLRFTRACLPVCPQNMLRSRRGQEPLGVAPSCAGVGSNPACPKGDPRTISGDSCGAGSGTGGEKGKGRPVGDGELDPTIARLVRKLATKKWVLLYDSLKATFTLQAEGIAREVVFEAMAAAADTAARDALGEGKGAERGVRERRRAAAAELEGLRGCVAAWEAFKDWCEEVRVTSAGCQRCSPFHYLDMCCSCVRWLGKPLHRSCAINRAVLIFFCAATTGG